MILLSIHPEYVAKIFSGEKTFEFRKHIPNDFVDKRIAVYSTSPVCKVVGFLEIEDVFRGTPSGLWRRVSKGAGISKSDFDAYFRGKENALAYKIARVHPMRKLVTLRSIGWRSGAPQSFCYLSKRISDRVVSLAECSEGRGS